MKLFNVLGVAVVGCLGIVGVASMGSGCTITSSDETDGGTTDTGGVTTDTPVTPGDSCKTLCTKAAAVTGCVTTSCESECTKLGTDAAVKGCSSQAKAFQDCLASQAVTCDAKGTIQVPSACSASLTAMTTCMTPAQNCGQCQTASCNAETQACTGTECQQGITCLNAATDAASRNACFNTNTDNTFAALGNCLNTKCKTSCF